MTPWPDLPLDRPLERIPFLFEPPGPFPAPWKAEAPPPVGQGAPQSRPRFTVPLSLPPWSVQHPHPRHSLPNLCAYTCKMKGVRCPLPTLQVDKQTAESM